MNQVTDWLLEGPSWVRYCTRIDLLGQSETAPEVVAARQAMLADAQVQSLITELGRWPGQALVRHNDAGHLMHKLVFISDIGLKSNDEGVRQIVKLILERRSQDGAFQLMTKISPRYGGTGEDRSGWMLCDTPSILYSLVKLGLEHDPAVQSAVRHLAGLSVDNGWMCMVSPELGKFRGPGRKSDPCPYATLISLKALSQIPEWRDSRACQVAAESLLQLWEQRKTRRPYLFAMGTDFTKLKAPMVWYDILHVLDVLTKFPDLYKDRRLLEMVDVIRLKPDQQGRFTAESVWKAWSNWEFGQKKHPSYLITLYVRRILNRLLLP